MTLETTVDGAAKLVLRSARRRYRNPDVAAEAVGLWWTDCRSAIAKGVPISEASRMAWRNAVRSLRVERFASPRPRRCTRTTQSEGPVSYVNPFGELSECDIPGYVDAVDPADALYRHLLDDRDGIWTSPAVRDAQEANALADL